MKIKMCYSLEKALLVALLWLHMADLIRLQPVAQSGTQQQQALVNRSRSSISASHQPTVSRNQQQPVILPSRTVKFTTTHGFQQQQKYHQISMCQVPEALLPHTKCRENQATNHNQTAMAEFKSKLEESSKDLRETLASYWEEIRTLSIDLVLVAKNNTLSKLQQNSEELLSRQSHSYEFTRRLFDSMNLYLHTHYTINQQELEHQQLSATSMHSATTSSSVSDLNKEVTAYFMRLYLIQAKRLLDSRLALSSNGEVDLHCLAGNLQTQNQVELLLAELSSPPEASLILDQKMLTQSIKQSLEFAGTLLGSLHLSKEMFHNLTDQASEWMTLSSCHEALARMTVCQECYPVSDETPTPVQATPPCENYCINVLRGCMADVYELDSFWNSHINVLAKFSLNMIQMNNIENVMSNLDEKLVAFMTKLNQQYNSTTSAPSIYELQQQQQSTNSLSFKMVKLCSRPAASNTEGKSTLTGFGSFRSAAHPRQAILLLPPTQSADRYGHFAHRARLHPEQSIFNRVDTLVHQLRKSRDFFSEWPQRLCQRIRRQELPAASSFNYQNQQPRKPTIKSPADSTLSDTFNVAAGTSTNCWNGRDFSGYNKPLVEFGKAITTSHPEVSASHTNPVNFMILNLVDKLKGIGAQLTRKSVTTPHLSLYQTLRVDALNSMSARADRLRAPQPNAVHSNGEPNDELISPSAKPLALQSSQLPQELLDAVIQLSKNHEERDENPINAADDHDYTGTESEDPDSYPQEDEDDYIECQKEDCSDIVSSIKPDLPTPEFDPPQPIPAAPVQENTPTVLLISNAPPTTIKYTIPAIIPFEGNDIYSSKYLQAALPEYTPRQSSGASDHLLQIGPLQVCALIAFTLLVTTLCLRPKAIRLLKG